MLELVIGCFVGLFAGFLVTSITYGIMMERDGIRVGEAMEDGLRSIEKGLDGKRARADAAIQNLNKLMSDVQAAGALDPYKSMDISMYVQGGGPNSLAGKWVRYAKEAQEKYSRATGQLNYMLKKVSEDLGVVEGDQDRFPEIEGVAVLIVADLLMRSARKKMEGKDLVQEFEEKYGGDIFTNNLNWM